VCVYLQKEELGQNTKALLEQAQELKASVEQYKDMVNITDRQLNVNISSLEIQKNIYEQKEKDFNYIYEKLNRDITLSLDEIDQYGEIEENITTYDFYINLGDMISHLIDFNNSEFNNIELPLKNHCLKLINKEEIFSGPTRFNLKINENIANILLVSGLVRVDYIPGHTSEESRGRSTISVRSVGPKHRYEFTDKFYKYRHWLELNEKYNNQLQLHLTPGQFDDT
ncbi:hypothetical protein VU11_07435, partial [Desulfobulbus sp. US2]|nr:hypothetical protein [Desulfobulbus sp. US2]